MALPFVQVSFPGPLQPYGLLLLGGITAGTLTSWRVSRRFGIPGEDFALLLAAPVAAAFLGHIVDVLFYQHEPVTASLMANLMSGHCVMGALLAIALVTLLVTVPRRRDLALYADVVALGTLVAMTIGRLGCAIVHDHVGLPTTSPIGIDMPLARARWVLPELTGDGSTVRVHDLGFEELLVLIPLTVIAFVLLHRRLRSGMTAAIAAIAYAVARFALDFLRPATTDPRLAGLTFAQWCCLVIGALAIVGLVLVQRHDRVAPLASELGGRPGGRHP
ncbi:MAG TPA: prolipoprotein diacylglyceryl transferase family protein [Kofleriaceae bacterium]|nr:prolipoprotein diacylglyceryl transferase family protein [Kofleriaceae bacterium]